VATVGRPLTYHKPKEKEIKLTIIMTKKTLKEYCNEIDVWDGWLNNYKKYVPNFIEETKTKVSWQDWDKGVFSEFFERSNDQCVSSLRQGYFTKEEQDRIKSNWNEIYPLLKIIVENQENPQWEVYKELKTKIRQYTTQDRKAATNRLVASLQPNLISTIVSEGDLGDLINKINTYTTSNISLEGDWFKRSYNVCKLFQQVLEPENSMDIITYPWQLLEHLREINSSLIEKQKGMESIIKLVQANKNLILTGAPGTGKTYKTAEIAVALIDGSNKLPNKRVDVMSRYKTLINEKQIAFTTFHQSLDYEEFIEGLKPEIDEDSGEMTYQVKNGIFKKICNKATSNPENLQLEKLVESIMDNAIKNATEYETTFHKIKFKIIDFSDEIIKIEHGTFNNPNWSAPKNPIVKINYSDLLQLLQQPKKILSKKEVATILKRKSKTTPDNYLIAINAILHDSVGQQNTTIQKNNSDEPKYYDFIRKAWSGEKLTDENKNYPIDKVVEFIKNDILFKKRENTNSQPHILIIDEINRGNISKIFGELITLLEKDKRIGEENEITVTLPYSQETFGVPSNLFIIGTMNTADRSIGHIDYAIRRRFSFLSLKSDRNVISSYDKYDNGTKEKAENLFDEIKDFISSNINADLDADDLMIGHSYFLCKTAEDLKMRLEFEIIPLIEEYEKDGIVMLEKSAMKTKFEEWKALL